ncbi:hypothetical protein [Streptomyces sp. NBC_01716]|nr:hypothetical protein [Streptomyces sp. NBC_01716]
MHTCDVPAHPLEGAPEGAGREPAGVELPRALWVKECATLSVHRL